MKLLEPILLIVKRDILTLYVAPYSKTLLILMITLTLLLLSAVVMLVQIVVGDTNEQLYSLSFICNKTNCGTVPIQYLLY